MAQTRQFWLPIWDGPGHSPARVVMLTAADHRRIRATLRRVRRFRMPTARDEHWMDTLTLDHTTRAATVSNGARLA